MDTMHWRSTYDGTDVVVTAEYSHANDEWLLTVRLNGALDSFTSSTDPLDGPALLASVLNELRSAVLVAA